MALTKQTDEQCKSVGGVTFYGGSILDLFADDAQVYFPNWGLASGKDQIGKLFGDVAARSKSIVHHYSHFNWIFFRGDVLACAGISHGEHRDGALRADVPGVGRWRDVFDGSPDAWGHRRRSRISQAPSIAN